MYLIIILSIVIILYFILKILQNNNNPANENLPYKSKFLLTKTEYAFYKDLKSIADNHNCIICPKVGLKDIIDVTDKQNYMKWFAKISQKHVDFLICDDKLKPLFALEYDDKSHDSEKAKVNDNFKNNLFLKIGLPLKRIKINNYDNLESLLFPTVDYQLNEIGQ